MTTLERNQLIKDGSNMSNDKPKSTYYSIAASDADLDLGGRYAKVHSTTVTGATPGSAFPQMESGPWAKDECPPEQPLGYSVNEQDPVDEMFERAAPAPVISRQGAGDSGGSAKDTGRAATKFARRF